MDLSLRVATRLFPSRDRRAACPQTSSNARRCRTGQTRVSPFVVACTDVGTVPVTSRHSERVTTALPCVSRVRPLLRLELPPEHRRSFRSAIYRSYPAKIARWILRPHSQTKAHVLWGTRRDRFRKSSGPSSISDKYRIGSQVARMFSIQAFSVPEGTIRRLPRGRSRSR